MDDRYLKELFSLPIGLKVALTVGGSKFFTSEKLKESFVTAFRKSSRGKDIANDIQTMVEKGTIVPCYKHKGLVKFFMKRMFGSPQDKDIMAMYYIEQKQILILIDNNISIFGTASNNELVSTTMHECMHLAAGKNLRKFLSIFTPFLRKFYGEFFTEIFNLKSLPKKELDKVIGFISILDTPAGRANINRSLTRYFNILETAFKPHTALDEELFMKALTDYIVAIKIINLNFNAFRRVYSKYSHLLNALGRSYKKAFGKSNTITGMYQEMFSVSEVICVVAELFPSDGNIKKAFKMMARG